MARPSTCKRCGENFVPWTLMSINLGRKRLTRCPHYRGWTDLNAPAQVREGPTRHEAGEDQGERFRRRIKESRLEELD